MGTIFNVRIFCPKTCGLSVSRPRMELTHPALEGDIIITGPPGRFLYDFSYLTPERQHEENRSGTLCCVRGGKGLEGIVTGPGAQPEVWGRRQKSPKSHCDSALCKPCPEQGPEFLLFQLRLPQWAIRPEFPENDCIFLLFIYLFFHLFLLVEG